MPRRVLITGAAGFVGAVLARRLIADGHDVAVLVRDDSDPWRLDDVRAHARVASVDLRDRDAVAQATADVSPDWIFHLAAHGAYSWQEDLQTMLAVNVLGTSNVIEAGVRAGVEAIVNAGSSSEYGYVDHPPSEGELPDPNSAYAATKVSATVYARWVARHRDHAITTLRLYSAYGPWEEPRRLIPALVVAALRDRLPPLASPDVARDFVYVEDVADAFVRAAERARPGDGAVYNIGSGQQTTLRRLVEVAREALGVSEQPAWGDFPSRRWDTDVWVADAARARDELGWSPTCSLAEGLVRTARWLRSVPHLHARYGLTV